MCFVTERTFGNVPRSVRSPQENDFAICAGGAELVRLRKEQVLVSHDIRREVVASVMGRMMDYRLAWSVMFHDSVWYEPLATYFTDWGMPMASRFGHYVRRAIFPEEGAHPAVSVSRILGAWSDDVLGMSCACYSPEERDKAYMVLAQRTDIHARRVGDAVVRIRPRGVDAGTTARELQRILEIAPEQTVAFGSGEGCLPLAQAAGTFVAMGDAVPELKESATETCGASSEDGMAVWLERLLEEDEAFNG